ncbi:MAG: ChuX/HutX family heme-like substrate-binding protein [Phycisphaeraceae bacterium]
MSKFLLQFVFTFVVLGTLGCTVTEPTGLDTKRVRSAVSEDPSVSIESLSKQLGVSELAVVRAMPQQYARAWRGTPAEAWSAVRDWPFAMVKTPHAAYFCDPKMVYVDADPNTPAFKGNLFVDIAWTQIEAVWLIRQPGKNGAVNAVWWFDDSGDAVLRAQVPWAGEEVGVSLTCFERMWDAAAVP